MSDEPKKIFDLMDTDTEPTDEQLEELMQFVAEEVRARHLVGEANLKRQLEEALAEVRQRESGFPQAVAK